MTRKDKAALERALRILANLLNILVNIGALVFMAVMIIVVLAH